MSGSARRHAGARRNVTRLVGVVALAATTVAGAPVAAVSTSAIVPLIPSIAYHHVYRTGLKAAPPTTATCQTKYGINCYSPNQLQVAYNTPKLYNQGITGRGRTIAVVDAFGSPTIAADLQTFDKAFGLPDPPSIKTITPAGKLPKFDPSGEQGGWAFETTLDVEYAHAMAPEANILVVATPVAETEGVQGLPEIVKAENYVIDHKLADVISQSVGATENTFPTKKSLTDLRSAVINAKQQHVTVLGSSGDAGATDGQAPDGATNYPYRVNSWPSSDPLVTSIGGTQLTLDATGKRLSPDVVWNDGYGAGGGGKSLYFARPAFQDSQRAVVGSSRGTPDISLSAAVDGGAIVYTSYDPASVGFSIVGGTSEASPLFAGIVALADQVAGKKLGDLNPALYTVAGQTRSGVVDVTSGNNSFDGVTGYPAKKGYDLASGLGTVNAATFVPALAAQAGGSKAKSVRG
jgi:subtilase family serine protease